MDNSSEEKFEFIQEKSCIQSFCGFKATIKQPNEVSGSIGTQINHLSQKLKLVRRFSKIQQNKDYFIGRLIEDYEFGGKDQEKHTIMRKQTKIEVINARPILQEICIYGKIENNKFKEFKDKVKMICLDIEEYSRILPRQELPKEIIKEQQSYIKFFKV